MNAPDRFLLPDLQNSADARDLAIDKVGIKSIRYPVTIAGPNGLNQATVAEFDMFVALPKHLKGTHMSRFVEALEDLTDPMSVEGFRTLHSRVLERLDAQAGYLAMRFTYFLRKRAPVSGVPSVLDYDVTFTDEVTHSGNRITRTRIVVPVTSLCPCSKEISAYGAHNQRSHITVTLHLRETVAALESFIRLVEEEASCEIYGLLKRPDEKYVTERAYDNPKFVEDLVRDVARRLEREPNVAAYAVEAENFESIHNHSAYALIERTKRTEPSILDSQL
jgi:GTP cyclohydrolase I